MMVVAPPVRVTCSMMPMTRSLPRGSSIDTGSSMASSFGRMARAPASARLCCSPPDRLFGLRSSKPCSSDSTMAYRTRSQISWRGQAEVRRSEGDVIFDGQREDLHLGRLEHDADVVGHLADVVVADRLAGDDQLALHVARLDVRHDTHQGFEQGGLTGSGLAHHAQDRPGFDGQGDVLERRLFAAQVAEGIVACVDQGHDSVSSPVRRPGRSDAFAGAARPDSALGGHEHRPGADRPDCEG